MRAAAFLICVLATTAAAAPKVGETIPPLQGRDVTGQQQSLRDLVQGKRTLLVTLSDRDAGDAMQAWFDAADTKAPQANRVSVISIHVPFFVSDDYARSKAREKVPKDWQHASLFDSDGKLAKALDVDGDEKTWAFALDENGTVLARVRGSAQSGDAERIWAALQSNAPVRKSVAAPR